MRRRFAFGGRLEGCSAAATARGLWILEAEAGTGEIVCVVERRTRDELRAFRIHDHLHSVAHGHRVARRHLIERHAVLQPGASAFLDENAESLRRLAFFGDERLELTRGGFGNRNHGPRT